MSNKVNYKNENTMVVSRSPIFRSNVSNKVISSPAIINSTKIVSPNIGKTLRNSIVNNINSINKVLDESNRILPYKNEFDFAVNDNFKIQIKGN